MEARFSENPPDEPQSAQGDLVALKARLLAARSVLVEASPFLGSLTLKLPLHLIDDPRILTACVDSRGICHFAKPFLEALSSSELRGVLLHETLHLALDAFPRCGTRRPLRWNVAHDFAINQLIADSDLMDGVVTLPQAFAPLLDPIYKGISAEEIYDQLPKDLKEAGLGPTDRFRDALEGMTREGRRCFFKAIGNRFDREKLTPEEREALRQAMAPLKASLSLDLPDDPEAWTPDEIQELCDCFQLVWGNSGDGDLWWDLGGELTAEQREELRNAWRERLMEAAEWALQGDKGIGSLPGWAQKLLGPLLQPQIPWEIKLAQRVHGHLKGRRRSFARPGRRSHTLGVTMPGPIKDRGLVGVFVDVSGSVGPSQLGAFLGELGGILRDADLPVRLITWDVVVQEDLLLEAPEDILQNLHGGELQLTGGGGTDPRCVIHRLQDSLCEDLPEPQFGVLLTDGIVPWPQAREWPLDLLVVVTDSMPPEALGYDAFHLSME